MSIPTWLLTVLHYVSLATAVVTLLLLGWHYLWPRQEKAQQEKPK